MRDAPNHRYERLTGLLERYISRITATAMLKTVLEDRGIAPERMTAEELSAIVEEVMIGLRLFCSPERLPDLMVELAELCDRESMACEEPLSRPAPSSRVMKPHSRAR